MKKILLGLLAAVVLLIAIVFFRTLMFTPDDIASTARATVIMEEINETRIAEHLSQAIQFKTISQQPPTPMDTAAFDGFIAWLANTYPEVHQSLTLHRLGGYTLLFEWKGSNPNLKPILLTGHYDVVPVIPGTENLWDHNPWSGDISDGNVWGRGSLDDKSAVVAQIEAATLLLTQGFAPERTIFLSFGHDEEIGGNCGAASVATYLASRNIQLAWTLDLVAHASGGHSSMPQKETAVGILSAAIVKLQEAPVPGGLDGISAQMMGTLAKHFPFGQRVLVANQWLFGGLLESQLSNSAFGNAMLRTTTAPTMLSASIKENVLPIEAIGTVNFRLHPRDTKEGLIAYVRKTIDDERIDIRIRNEGSSASAVSSTQASGYLAIAKTSVEVFGDLIVTPGITVAGTDTKHYATVADDSYRFNPMIVGPEDLSGFHGTNERVSIANLRLATTYYARLMQNSAGQ